MVEELEFVVPGQPTGKGRPRFRISGRAYTPKKTAMYENLFLTAFTEKYPEWDPTEKPVILTMHAYYAIPKSFSRKKHEMAINMLQSPIVVPTKKPDLDNIIKCIDGLNGIAWKDDSQVIKITAMKHYSESPSLVVKIVIPDEEMAVSA